MATPLLAPLGSEDQLLTSSYQFITNHDVFNRRKEQLKTIAAAKEFVRWQPSDTVESDECSDQRQKLKIQTTCQQALDGMR